MLRQIEWWILNGPITKNGVLPVTTLFFWKFCFSLRTSYKKLMWCTNDPNAHILTFCKRWSFIWQYFFPLSILNWYCKHMKNVRSSQPAFLELNWVKHSFSLCVSLTQESTLVLYEVSFFPFFLLKLCSSAYITGALPTVIFTLALTNSGIPV